MSPSRFILLSSIFFRLEETSEAQRCCYNLSLSKKGMAQVSGGTCHVCTQVPGTVHDMYAVLYGESSTSTYYHTSACTFYVCGTRMCYYYNIHCMYVSCKPTLNHTLNMGHIIFLCLLASRKTVAHIDSNFLCPVMIGTSFFVSVLPLPSFGLLCTTTGTMNDLCNPILVGFPSIDAQPSLLSNIWTTFV